MAEATQMKSYNFYCANGDGRIRNGISKVCARCQAKVKYIKSEPNEEGKWKKACHGLYGRGWTTKRRRAQKSAIPASNQ